jgi:hypothetical protein
MRVDSNVVQVQTISRLAIAILPKSLSDRKSHQTTDLDLSARKRLRKKHLSKFAVIDLTVLVNICQLE